MKPYDFLFFAIIILILLKKNNSLFITAGFFSLILSMINFALLIGLRLPSEVLSHIGIGPVRISFETAAHLTWYAAGFFFLFILISLGKGISERK